MHFHSEFYCDKAASENTHADKKRSLRFVTSRSFPAKETCAFTPMLLKEGLCTDSHTRWGGALCKHSTTTHKYRHSPKNMLLSIAPQAQGFAVFPLWCPASVCVSMDSSLGMSHTLLRGVCVSACVFNPTAASVASLHAALCTPLLSVDLRICLSLPLSSYWSSLASFVPSPPL